jgi:hypothetical protein
MEWLNKGVAPAYSSYRLKGKLVPVDNSSETIVFEIEDSGNRKWMPNSISVEKYKVSLPKEPKGKYQFAIQLFDNISGKTVEIGLSADLKVGDYFNVQNLSF